MGKSLVSCFFDSRCSNSWTNHCVTVSADCSFASCHSLCMGVSLFWGSKYFVTPAPGSPAPRTNASRRCRAGLLPLALQRGIVQCGLYSQSRPSTWRRCRLSVCDAKSTSTRTWKVIGRIIESRFVRSFYACYISKSAVGDYSGSGGQCVVNAYMVFAWSYRRCFV